MGLRALLLAFLALAAAAPAPAPAPSRATKEVARRARFFDNAKSPLSREDVDGWLFGSYYRYDPGRAEYIQEHLILVRDGGKLVPFSWPMGEGPSAKPEEGRLGKIAAALPAEARRCRSPSFGPREIVFDGADKARWRVRKYGEDLFLRVDRKDAEPGYAILTEKMRPPAP